MFSFMKLKGSETKSLVISTFSPSHCPTTCYEEPPAPEVSRGHRNLVVTSIYCIIQFITENLLSSSIPITSVVERSQGFLFCARTFSAEPHATAPICRDAGTFYLFVYWIEQEEEFQSTHRTRPSRSALL